MSKKQQATIPEIEEEDQDQNEPIVTVKKTSEPDVKKKRTRTMSKEALEKLAIARAKAFEVRKNSKQVNAEHQEVRRQTQGEKVQEIETYKKIKERVDNELKQNEILNINKKLENMNSKFEDFLQDRERRKQEKAAKKEQMKADEIARQLPISISRAMLDEELKRQELDRFRRRVFGC